ncbi:MAG: hypothetical protein JWM80_3713 [Cyanobacteria bacterium RYN_339]|nr:hypothetical protein [Cyanobacteria bacterium RYN_339]
MSEPAKGKPGKPGKDPFGPPLEPAQVREFFRRLEARPAEDQRAFVAKVNWNLLDATIEARLMAWLADALQDSNRDFALGILDKLPHPKRARHVERFRAALADLPAATAEKLQNAFGPVLGGLPKRPGGKAAPATNAPPAAKTTQDPKEASGEDLERLKAFFDKFGGAR